MAPTDPTICRMVVYRSKVGGYDLPAVITATVATLAPEGVKLYRETKRPDVAPGEVDLDARGVPPLSSPDHVHLTVLSPGLPGNGPVDGLDENLGGSYREWNVPLWEPYGIADPRPGAMLQQAEPEPGSWRWPERA